MNTFFTVFLAGALTDNLVLNRILSLPEAAEKNDILDILKKSGLLTALMLLSVSVTYPLIHWVLNPLGIGYLSTLLCILVICAILTLSFMLSKKYLPTVYSLLDQNRAIFTCSTAILGVCLLAPQSDFANSYPLTLVYAASSGLGFLIVSVIISTIRARLETAELPKAVTGLPLMLLIASLLSLAFGGFA